MERGACARLPRYARIDLYFLAAFVAILGANAVDPLWPPSAGLFALGLTGVLFVSGMGYLHALGALHQQTRRGP